MLAGGLVVLTLSAPCITIVVITNLYNTCIHANKLLQIATNSNHCYKYCYNYCYCYYYCTHYGVQSTQ